jgi:hypothetical protein
VILFYRLTPFVLALAAAVMYVTLIFAPFTLWPVALISFLLIPLLLARLLLFEWSRPAFWVFLGTPCLLLVSSLMFFVLLESDSGKWALAAIVTLTLAIYTENLFAFYHLPSTYQAYSLEYLTLVIYVASAFFFTSSAYMAELFLELPLFVPAIAVFVAVLFATMGVFWVSKIGFETGIPFAVTGAILMTELYISLSFLPTSFVTNAAVFAVCLSTYFGLVRAQVLEKLSVSVVRRYVGLGLLLIFIILSTATWL